MANSQDARPFVDLKKDAEEFQAKFDEDIQECINFLDTKISALVCDPDSLGNSGRHIRQNNALLEFSKAKYDIFVSVKSLINSKEREWLDYISEMKKLFIENVEIFLAGTKLEVKLPSEYEPSHGPRKSPGNRRSNSSVASSIITNIASSIPVLGSSLLNKDASNKEVSNVENEPQPNRNTISVTVKSPTIGDRVQSNRRSRLPAAVENPQNVTVNIFQDEGSSSNSSDVSENETVRNKVQSLRRGRTSAASIKLAKSPMHSYKEAEESDTNSVGLDVTVIAKTPSRSQKSTKKRIETPIAGPSKSTRNVTFTSEANIGDDLEMFSPVARPAKSSTRRKTLLPNLEEASDSVIIPGNPSRTTAKRKTIGGVSELESVAPSKRLRGGREKNISSIQEGDDATNDNLLESDDNYSDWIALKNVDGKIPTQPAIYEVKVWRAKKPAYIGSCESLRQRLTLYKLRQNSGHKHLDKFIDRNYDDIQIRFEVASSIDEAKGEVKSRVNRFVQQYKNTPAYN